MLKILFALYVSDLKIPKNMLVAAKSFLILNLRKTRAIPTNIWECSATKRVHKYIHTAAPTS